MLLHVMAEEELTFPFDRWSLFRDLELDERRVQLDPRSIRAEYLERVRQFIQRLEQGCGADGHRLRAALDATRLRRGAGALLSLPAKQEVTANGGTGDSGLGTGKEYGDNTFSRPACWALAVDSVLG